MPTVTKINAHRQPRYGGVPYGNLSKLPFKFATNASGVMADSDKVTAVAVADKVVLGVLPAGMELVDCMAFIPDAFTAATTGALGFEYKDGVDDAGVPQDADFFFAATTTAVTAVLRKTNPAAPVQLPKDAYLILTVGGADHASAGLMDVFVIGELKGNP